jgi:hypothetical protein
MCDAASGGKVNVFAMNKIFAGFVRAVTLAAIGQRVLPGSQAMD